LFHVRCETVNRLDHGQPPRTPWASIAASIEPGCAVHHGADMTSVTAVTGGCSSRTCRTRLHRYSTAVPAQFALARIQQHNLREHYRISFSAIAERGLRELIRRAMPEHEKKAPAFAETVVSELANWYCQGASAY
jgi:hypothetical protein